MESVHITHYEVSAQHADPFGRCKPSALLRFAQDAAGEHCALLGADRDTLSRHRYFWAVVRQRLEISRLPAEGVTVTVKTWPMPTTRVAYPRATEGFDAQGNSLFKIISLWVIMDMDSRAMVLPGKCGIDVPGITLGTELKTPPGILAGSYVNQHLRTVEAADLDINGHMNNARYLDWLWDLLDTQFHQTHPLKAVSISYNNEALEGQTLQLCWEMTDTFRLDGVLSRTDANAPYTRIFSAQAEF